MKELILFAAVLFFIAATLYYFDDQPEMALVLTILSVCSSVASMMFG